jgi:two-component system response regulator NreC
LSAIPDFSVVGVATEAAEVIPLFDATKPDVITMDVTLPGADGISAARELKAHHPEARILMLTAHALPDYVTQAMRVGVAGYALKSQAFDDIVAGITAVARGERYLAPQLPASLLTAPGSSKKSPGTLERLSNREREVFNCVVRGCSNAEMSRELSISVKTVETHRANINRKLSVHSSTQLIRFAALRGLVPE